MNKAELIDAVAEAADLPKASAGRALDAVLEAGIAGNRDEMLEVVIDPLRLEAYNVTADELINVVRNNNQLIAAGEVETAQGSARKRSSTESSDCGSKWRPNCW